MIFYKKFFVFNYKVLYLHNKHFKTKIMQVETIKFMNGSLRYVRIENEIAICADDFFEQVQPLLKPYQVGTMEAYLEVHREGKDAFYTLDAFNDRLIQYKPQKATFNKNPARFADFISFVQKGGLNQIYEEITGVPGNFENKDIEYLLDGSEMPANCEEIEAEYKAEIAVIESEKAAIEALRNSISDSLNSAMQHNEKLISDLDKSDKENNFLSLQNAELSQKVIELEAIKTKHQKDSSDWLRSKLTNSKMMLYATIMAIGIFLPFTILNLKEYIAIDSGNWIGEVALYILCTFIAAAWDFSILIFAVNSKRNLAVMGSCFQFIFISAKFDFFKSYVDLFGWNGELFQSMIVITAIVIYSPVLVYQFAELAMKGQSDSKI